jgi:hypothetical protein
MDSAEHPTTNRFLLEVEAAIVDANRRAIRQRLQSVSRRQFEALAARVAELRADYLAAAFGCDWTVESVNESDIGHKRRLYDEAVAAFDALERAVRRGYVEIR